MKILAIDLALTRTGWVSANVEEGRTSIELGIIRGDQLRGPERLAEITNRLRVLAEGCHLVALEGYAYGVVNSKNAASAVGRAFDLGECGGCVKTMLWQQRHRVAIIPPANIKKYATGKGNANKDLVFAEAIRRLGYQGDDKNETDALWIAAMCLDKLGVPLVHMPQTNQAGLINIDWPELPAVAG